MITSNPHAPDPEILFRKLHGQSRAVVHACGHVLKLTVVYDEKTVRLGCRFRDPYGLKMADDLTHCPGCKKELISFFDDKEATHYRNPAPGSTVIHL